MAHVMFGPDPLNHNARSTPRLAPPDRSNRCWTVRWAEREADGSWRTRRFSTRCKTRADAERVYQDWLEGFLTRNPTTKARTLRDVAEEYLRDHAAPRGLERYQRMAMRAALLAFGDRTTDTLTPQVWDRYATARMEGQYAGLRGGVAKASTVRRELSAVRAALNWAVRKGRTLADHIHPVPMPLDSSSPAREVWLDEEQAEDFLAKAEAEGGMIELAVFILMFTGARRGALMDLDWSRVDLAKGQIDFRNPSKRVSRKRRAVVPIAKRLRPVLERHRKKSGPVIEGGGIDWFGVQFRRFAERADYPHITPHALRHTFITLRLRAGVDPWKVAGVVADSLQTILSVYGHHRPDHLSDAVDL